MTGTLEVRSDRDESSRKTTRRERETTRRDGGSDGVPAAELQVLVVGGGVAGLTLAGFLYNRGFQTVVIGRSRDGDRPDRPLFLAPESVASLGSLTLDTPVRAVGDAVRSWSLHGPDGTLRSRRERGTGDAPAIAIRRSDLEACLAEALPGDAVRRGTGLARLDQSRPGVDVEFDDGVREQFDVVVGADGVHSDVRGLVWADASAQPLGTTTWTLPVDSPPGAPDELYDRLTANGSVVSAYPSGGGHVARVSTPTGGGHPDEAARDRFRDLVASVAWLSEDALEAARRNDHHRRDEYRVQADAWHEGRVALLGNAAHARHSMALLGETLAVEDAAGLADELTRCAGEPARALSTYAARRRVRVNALLARRSDADSVRSLSPSLSNALDVRRAFLSTTFAGT